MLPRGLDRSTYEYLRSTNHQLNGCKCVYSLPSLKQQCYETFTLLRTHYKNSLFWRSDFTTQSKLPKIKDLGNLWCKTKDLLQFCKSYKTYLYFWKFVLIVRLSMMSVASWLQLYHVTDDLTQMTPKSVWKSTVGILVVDSIKMSSLLKIFKQLFT